MGFLKLFRLFDAKGEVKNPSRPDGSYSFWELQETKKYMEPNGGKWRQKAIYIRKSNSLTNKKRKK
jgi:hypothetical protein